MTSARQPNSAVAPAPGDVVGPYVIRSPLGEGGMGRVYKAEGPDGAQVALKLIKGNLAADEKFRRRFEREARAASRLSHRYLVPLIEAGEHDGIPYIAQQFIPGGSLDQRIRREGMLDPATAVKVCLQVASGLEAIHQAGLVHRDLKPGNILLDEDGSARITDFGLAKDPDASVLTKPGEALGSIDYMAPEQIRGEEVTATTDVYALGCVTFECLNGVPPFGDRHGTPVLFAHLHQPPPDLTVIRPDVPKDLCFAVARALEKDPAKRPPSAAAWARIVQVAKG